MKDSHLTLALKKFNSFEEGIFSKKKLKYTIKVIGEKESKESVAFYPEQLIEEVFKL